MEHTSLCYPRHRKLYEHIDLCCITSFAYVKFLLHLFVRCSLPAIELSGGTVKLNSSDPLDPPLIDPAFLASEFDVFAMVEAVKSAKRFLSAPAWEGYVLEAYGGLVNATTDEALEEYVRENSGTAAHPVGTASMSPRFADYGVVDPDLLVKGVTGLRVVDASIFVGRNPS